CQINRLGIEFELAGFDLREVEYLVDEAQEVGPGGIDTAQRFQRLFRAEARRVGRPSSRFRPMIALSGVCSSWLMLARNRNLRSLASASYKIDLQGNRPPKAKNGENSIT